MKCKEPWAAPALGPQPGPLLGLMAGIRAAIEAGRYAAFQRETLAALDRHEHDPRGGGRGDGAGSRRRPGRRLRRPSASRGGHRLGRAGSGRPAGGEVMHPVIGAAVESERLYVAQARLGARLAAGARPWCSSTWGWARPGTRWRRRAPPGCAAGLGPPAHRQLRARAGSAGAGLLGRGGAAARALARGPGGGRALLARGRHEEERFGWRLALGDALAELAAAPERADSSSGTPSRRGPTGALEHRRLPHLPGALRPGAALFTYSTATAVRSALLLAGSRWEWAIPRPKEETPPPQWRRPLRPAARRPLALAAGALLRPFPADAPPEPGAHPALLAPRQA